MTKEKWARLAHQVSGLGSLRPRGCTCAYLSLPPGGGRKPPVGVRSPNRTSGWGWTRGFPAGLAPRPSRPRGAVHCKASGAKAVARQGVLSPHPLRSRAHPEHQGPGVPLFSHGLYRASLEQAVRG